MTARVFVTGAALLMTALANAAAPGAPVISVHEADGEYHVAARFTVQESAGVARDVLTDYANIPRFMPDVQTSIVGSPSACREQIQRFAEAGVDELILIMQMGTVPLDVVATSIRLFGEKVLPYFADSETA